MRLAILLLMAAALTSGFVWTAEDKKPPEKIVFPSKAGDVPFDHAAHVKRADGDCATCHDKLWPQSTKVPLKSSEGCRTCHHAGGRSFETNQNCKRCHPETGGKAGGQ